MNVEYRKFDGGFLLESFLFKYTIILCKKRVLKILR